MAVMTLIQAVTHTLDQAMGRDENVCILGEDVGKNGGVFRATDGLWAKYGDARVLDTPLNESLIIGGAIGMALYGLDGLICLLYPSGWLSTAFHAFILYKLIKALKNFD